MLFHVDFQIFGHFFAPIKKMEVYGFGLFVADLDSIQIWHKKDAS